MNTLVLISLISVAITCLLAWSAYKFWKWVKTLYILLIFISLTLSCSKKIHPADFKYEKKVINQKAMNDLKIYHCNK